MQVTDPPNLDSPDHLKKQIVAFRCPADTSPTTLEDRGGFGTSNYVGNYGVELIPEKEDAAPASGTFFRNSIVRMRDIRDGTSNTIMVGERGKSTGGALWALVRSNAQAEDAVASSNDKKKINTIDGAYSSDHDGGAYFLMGDGAVRFVSEKIASSKETEGKLATFQALANRDDGRNIDPKELQP